MSLSHAELEKLLEAARMAAKHAYAPYSKLPQGAALLTDSGEIFTGASAEFATYGGSISADIAALVNAMNAGKRKFKALCVQPFSYPSGVARQFFAEFGIALTVVAPINKVGTASENSQDEASQYRTIDLQSLLPEHFGPANLEAADK